jgi:hypothetical protein
LKRRDDPRGVEIGPRRQGRCARGRRRAVGVVPRVRLLMLMMLLMMRMLLLLPGRGPRILLLLLIHGAGVLLPLLLLLLEVRDLLLLRGGRVALETAAKGAEFGASDELFPAEHAKHHFLCVFFFFVFVF